MPIHAKRARKASHASAPTRPVVMAEVGMNPTPDVKSMFQNMVSLRLRSRNASHWEPKLPGPEPKSGDDAYVWLPTVKVDCQDGTHVEVARAERVQ